VKQSPQLHIFVGVRRFEGIASPDCHQARNDEKRVVRSQWRNKNIVNCYSKPSNNKKKSSVGKQQNVLNVVLQIIKKICLL
jgi:hypothetical protein